jgi:hypothetical protein
MEAPQDFRHKVSLWKCWDGPLRRQSLSEKAGLEPEVIEPWVATGKLTCADFTQQVKAYWFVQNRKQQPLVAQVRRLPSLRKGDSLKVGQPAPLSSRMIGQPLSHRRKGLRCFHLLYKVKAGKALGVILRFSTRCYLTYRTFPPDSIIQDHYQLCDTVYKTLFGILVYWA